MSAPGQRASDNLDPRLLARARDFMLGNARVLDRHLFAYLFDESAAQPVLDALRAYRNRDGGFGHALEPDKRCPDSQPVDVEVALGILDVIGAAADPMVPAACDWLDSIADASGGLPFALPTVNAYPHAPWWRTAEARPWINPTGSIVGLLTKWGVDHPWVARGTAFCWHVLETQPPTGFHDLRCALAFLEQARDRERAAAFLGRARSYLKSSTEIAFDLDASGYVHPPLHWAPTPTGFAYGLFERTDLEAGLAALADAQREDGGWPISWQAITPGVELEWRGRKTIDALLTLSAYAESGYAVG
ncbi:MAG: hypothetical protein OXH15_02795 [Gammaproteobacteria bacterium]|nr:hypothetical protein [Gammaproteobacteria bacterium]